MRAGLMACVIFHFVLSGLHGASHLQVPVPLNEAQQSFIALIVLAAPPIGACLAFTRHRVFGAALVCVAMSASLIFGIAYHFVIDSADHVARVPVGPGHRLFVVTAVAIAFSEMLGAACGAIAWRRWTAP